MQIIFLGLPGAGKGTQAQTICEDFGIAHVATGDMFRTAKASGSPLGEKLRSYIDFGRLVPDDVTIEIVRERLHQADAQKGFLLDGFPRTIPQAQALDEMLTQMGKPLSHVLYLQVRTEELLTRLTGRRVCAKCGTSYHVAFNPPQHEGICDRCGGVLSQRADDTPEAVAVRLQENLDRTTALAAFYEARGLLTRVNGEEAIGTVYSAIRQTLRGGRS
ncbi:MAG: adenylate kinase [Firmicutes bacterium]|nr:adenylate kinase [Bacillota bacterium]